LTGYQPDETVGHHPKELLRSGWQDQPFYEQLWQTILAGRAWHGELINRRKDGSLYNEEMTITPVMDAQGKVTHFIAVKQDITEHKMSKCRFTIAFYDAH
jgi:PAS domain S-box-containing protein